MSEIALQIAAEFASDRVGYYKSYILIGYTTREISSDQSRTQAVYEVVKL
jgi:hypothetical protein